MSRVFHTLNQFNNWLRVTHSTNLTIVVGLVLANVFVYTVLLADIIRRPISDATQGTLALFITGMITAGVTQFTMKRKTDDNYIRAKAGLEPAPRGASASLPVQEDAP